LINRIALIILGALLIFLLISNAEGAELDNTKHEKTASLIIQSMMQEPDKWIADEYIMYYYKDKEALKIARETEPDRKTATLSIWISNGVDYIAIQNPFIYKFSKKQQKQIWNTYRKWAEHQFVTKDFNHITENIFDKKVQTAQTSPILAIPVKITKDVLTEIKTDPKKVIETEQNNNKGIVLLIVLFILGIETFFITGLFTSKDFRKIIFRNNG